MWYILLIDNHKIWDLECIIFYNSSPTIYVKAVNSNYTHFYLSVFNTCFPPVENGFAILDLSFWLENFKKILLLSDWYKTL
jgi:hypothetical protein